MSVDNEPLPTDPPRLEAGARGGLPVALLSALRPKQWIKNAFVVAPAIFAGELGDPNALRRVAAAVAAFCAVASATYLLNDVLDREADRQHPKKCRRAIASGLLPVPTALAAAGALAIGGLGLAAALGVSTLAVVFAYVLSTVGYTLYFKHSVILDVMFLAAGFVLRVFGGAVAARVEASEWLLLCTLLLALFLGFSKRRHELTLLEGEAASHRRVLVHYSSQLLDQMLVIVATSAILCYILYTVWPSTVEKFGTKHLVFTVPFVIYGILRYFYLIHERDSGGDPTDSLLTDGPLLLDVLLWAAVASGVIYLKL
jgi:4-hydroxybenzoate polyprenyltransferase